MTYNATPLEAPQLVATSRRSLSIGLPASADAAERRFPLTPEGAEQLAERGFMIKMQRGAAESINYADSQYERAGVMLCERPEALGCDIVVSLAPLTPTDARAMRKGAMLLTLERAACANPSTVRELLLRHIVAIALDLVEDEHGCRPFADILAEIDGRASLAMASSLLADPRRGKGILLGGVAGVVSCEVMIIGSGIAACAAAQSALGLGAMVRMFDSDVYSLRRAARELGPGVITSSLHPHTLENALRSADVLLVTPTAEPFRLHADTVSLMKRGVLTFDLTPDCTGEAFPSMTPVDLADASAIAGSASLRGRICYVHAGSAVARTAAMALSDTLRTLMHTVVTCEGGASNALKLHPGIQKATLTFFGKAVNPRLARCLGVRSVDISIYLSLS